MFDQLLGLHVPAHELTFQHMALRSLVVFAFGVALVRCADRRFLGRNAGFDVLLGIILGSVLSRAINGQASFLPTLGASAVLVLLHRILGTIACRSHVFSRLMKGNAEILVSNGQIDDDALKRNKISRDDLDENLRLNGNAGQARSVFEARLERNGMISVVKRPESGARDSPQA